MSPCFVFLRFGTGAEVCRMSPPIAPSCCKGVVRALEVCRVSPLFLLVGLGERVGGYHISFAFVLSCSYYEG